MILIGRAQAPLMGLANLITQYDEARAAVAIVGKLMSQPTEEGRAGHGVRTPLEGNVEFSNVRFKYAGSLSYALDGVSFEAPKGWTLGVVGRSGSGKTTVTRLLQRLHSDYEGLIKIDGVDVREYDVAHLRRSLGVVLQENFLFSGTIRENITAAKPHATFDDMVRAARLAGAEEFIDRLPRGYETHIYEGSPNLSGGQRQRLAIARALILDPKILILDEATSALDPDSEAIVNENIRRIAMGRTVIVISHDRDPCELAGGLRNLSQSVAAAESPRQRRRSRRSRSRAGCARHHARAQPCFVNPPSSVATATFAPSTSALSANTSPRSPRGARPPIHALRA
jgi:subfamily B ATP-binding cassette protein HlyB/CyaB